MDASMLVAPHPADERKRIAALEKYRILDTLPEQVYDDITYLAASICATPIALISFVDRERQWFKSKVGLGASETSRDHAFCAHAILRPHDLLVVPDATQDRRFAQNPLVLTDPKIRFYAGAPLAMSEGSALGTLCVIDREARELDDEQRKALLALSRQVMGQLELRKAVTELRHLALKLGRNQERLERYQRRLEEANVSLATQSRTDSLTGLANRAAFDERLDEELHRAWRHQRDLALLLADVDRFKSFNDEFGHLAGDVVLKRVAELLLDRSRSHDLVARFGGEEFAAILPDTDREGAMILAERFRRVIETAPWQERPVTISIGAAVASDLSTCRELIDRTDQALYAAKRQGRNRVVEAPPAPESAASAI
jgi:diguanylate cyclase (GGDEF)-like protein